MKRLLCVLAVAVLAGAPTLAFGAEERSAAREIFDAAQKLFAGKNYRAAALAFESAAEKEPHGGAYYAAGVSWHEAGEPARAADNLAHALGLEGLDPHMASDARARLAAIESRVGRIQVNAPRGTRVTVAHVTGQSPPVSLHATPGEHVVNVSWPNGYASSHSLRVAPGRRAELYLTSADAPVGWGSEPGAQAQSERSSGPSWRTWGFVGAASGVVVGAAGVVLISSGLSARDEFDQSGQTDEEARDRAITLRTWGNVLLIGGAAVAAGGLTLALLSPSDERAPGSAALTLRPSSVELSATF